MVEEAMVGAPLVEVNPFGPLQLYVPPAVAVKEIVEPSQYGPVLVAVGSGSGFTVTDRVAVPVQPEASVTVAE